MGWVSGIAVYFIIWWTVLFLVLPWGVQAIGSEDVARGHAAGAPLRPNMWRKVAATSVVAAVFSVIVYVVIETERSPSGRIALVLLSDCRRRSVHRAYHDEEYGFPVADDRILFERLSLETFQAGLSWRLMTDEAPGLGAGVRRLRRRRVAAFDEADVSRLLADTGIIRNRRKIEAVIAMRDPRRPRRRRPGRRPRRRWAWRDRCRRTIVLRRMACLTPSAHGTGVAVASSADVSIHGPGGRARVPGEYRLSCGCARRRLSRPGTRSRGAAGLADRRGRRPRRSRLTCRRRQNGHRWWPPINRAACQAEVDRRYDQIGGLRMR